MVDLKLYLLCAIGGFAIYFIFNLIMYGSLRKPIGISYYQGSPLTVKRIQSHALMSAILIVALLVVYYLFRVDQDTPMNNGMYIFVALAGFISARGIFPLVLDVMLPAGLYEQGVISERASFTRYKDIKNYDFLDTGKRRDAGVVYLRMYTSNSKLFGTKYLVVDKEDKTKVQKIMKQRMSQISKQY